MGNRSGFDADGTFGELLNVVDLGSGAVSAATRQAAAVANLGFTASLTQINNVTNQTNPLIAGGATLTLTPAQSGGTVQLNTAAGSVITLPAATGSGATFTFYVSVLATSNSHIIYTSSANGVGGTANNFVGLAFGTRVDSGNAVLGFAAQSTSNTITLNRSTTGSVTLGEWIIVKDVAAATWRVEAFLSATGAAFATPFSHT
jgi:hypothetical protein